MSAKVVTAASANPADQRVWGPHAWHFLHSIAETYDPSKRESLLAFMRSLPDLLPCSVCGDHLREHLKAMDVEKAAGSAREMSRFMWELHNRVNADTGKPRWPEDAPRIPDLGCGRAGGRAGGRAEEDVGIFARGGVEMGRRGRIFLIILLLLIAIALVVWGLRRSRWRG